MTGRLTSGAAESLGLPPGIPVVGGGGDQAAQAVGVGAVEPGIDAVTLGTSGVVFAATRQPIVEAEGRLHSFCHSVPDRWHLMGVMLSAGGSLRWYRDNMAPGVDFDRLLEPAEAIPAGCEGLLFLPYLSGGRTPHPDPLARGAFVGLTGGHTLAHLTRSGVGVWPDVNAACGSVVVSTHRYHPRPESASRYERQHEHYRRLYPALKDIFHGLGSSGYRARAGGNRGGGRPIQYPSPCNIPVRPPVPLSRPRRLAQH